MWVLLWRFYHADYCADYAALIVQIHGDCALYGELCRRLHHIWDLS